MKRIISLIALVSILSVLLTGCGRINVDKSVEKLKTKGMTDGIIYETDEDLELGTELYNTEIEYWGGDFTVKLKGYVTLVEDRDFTKSVQFITFSSKREAKAYAELYIEKRTDYNNFLVAQKGPVVVLTNLEFVTSELGLDFE